MTDARMAGVRAMGARAAGGRARRFRPGRMLRPLARTLLRALLALLALGGAAAAQTVTVRTGDHPSFARLVFAIPPGAAWTLEPAPGGVALSLPPGAAFDLSGAFDRIRRDRVAGLSPDGARLLVEVACACHAAAFLFQPDRLVLDVADGPAPEGAVTPGAPFLAGPPAPAAPHDTPPDLAPGTVPDSTTEAAILEGLARAASQGFLDVAPGEAGPPLDEGAAGEGHAADALEPPPDAPPAGPAVLPGPPAAPGIAVRTASDRGAARPPLGATGETCLADERLDLAAWGGADWGAEVPQRLARLVDARDRLDPEAVEELARAYLAFGFGREAAQALRVDGAASAERDLLLLLAALVDGEPVAPGALADQGGCLGAVALWRALARGTLEGTDERERTAVSVALRALPPALRGHLAVRVAGLFLDAGDAGAARAMADLARDTDAGRATAAGLADAAIAGAAEGPGAELGALTALAREDARMTPAAMVELIEGSVAAGRAVPDDILALARALRFEEGTGETARDLLLVEVAALAAAGRFAEAVALAEDGRGAWEGEAVEAALGEAVEAMAERAEDAAFLELALGDLPPRLPPAAANGVARRLLQMGFPPEAQALLAPDAQGGPMAERRFLRAEAALALRDAAGVEAALAGLGDERADDLRDRAAALAPPPAAVAEGPPPPEPEPGPAPPSEGATLADGRALLEEAGAARERAAALLSEAPPG